ncbi:metallophosphoesterase [Zhongshania sp.]|uniref:metallophosphoesterase n=1 Tax=Zhongshania sp. TaxID=1971902 RepID=UPI00356B5446
MKKRGKSILVIPDSHARPNNDMRRFAALGNFITEKKPDVVISIGDWADVGSLCSYDKGTLHAEGRRYADDVAASREALALTMGPVQQEVDRIIRNKKRRWHPEFHITIGNHEQRIIRAQTEAPEYYGAFSIDDLGFKDYGWNVVDYMKPLVIDGIAFQHYFTSGVMGRPIGGVNHARTLVLKNYMSSVCGHSHMRDYWEDTRTDGQRIFGLVVGCYDEGDHHYTEEQKRWWSGLVMLHEVEDGSAEPAFFSTDYVLRRYL